MWVAPLGKWRIWTKHLEISVWRGLFQENLLLLTHLATLLQVTHLSTCTVTEIWGTLWHFCDYRTSTSATILAGNGPGTTNQKINLMAIVSVNKYFIELTYLLCSLPVFAWPHILTSVHITVQTSMPAFHSQTNNLLWNCVINSSIPHYLQRLFKSDITMGIPDLCLFLLAYFFMESPWRMDFLVRVP